MTAVLPGRLPGTAPSLPPVAEPARATGSPVGVLRGVGAFAVRWSVRALVAVAVLAFAGLALGPHVLGYRTMTMLTASMAPGIEPGDVVVTTPLPVEDVAPGMVISYHIPVDDHRVVTHRVVSVEHGPDGAVMVRTKGDANEHVDPWIAVLKGDTAYQVRAVVPELGHLISALRTPVVTQLLVYGAPALLAGWLLMTIWRPAPRTREDAE
ncbi:MAG TPA: signal peptidase I [Geodermatophilus sp.]|nr:signal peptidase I [Geodermatophilus sp.]